MKSNDDNVPYYTGNSGLWAEISIGSENDSLTITEIHYNNIAFAHVINLPAVLSTIESEAFTGLSSVEAISIHAAVNSIADDAFDTDAVIVGVPIVENMRDGSLRAAEFDALSTENRPLCSSNHATQQSISHGSGFSKMASNFAKSPSSI